MKKIISLFAVSSALLLSACGGSSSSSSFEGSKQIGNSNKYSCPSKEALDTCISDTTCNTACTLTFQLVEPVNESTKNCAIDGMRVQGVLGETCKTPITVLGGDYISCLANGTLVYGNGVKSTNGAMTYNNYTFTCKNK